MKYLKTLIILLLAASACQKLDYPELDSANTLSALKCYVYYNADNLKEYKQVDPFTSGRKAELGEVTAILYTFPDDTLYNESSLKRCRLEATIPSTASLVELDAAGNELGHGIGGLRDLSSASVYFKVVAADGSEKRYQARFSMKK